MFRTLLVAALPAARSRRSCARLAAALAWAPVFAPPAYPQGNVLLLVADDLGVDAVQVYCEGSAPPPTPHIDALAARGVLFRNAYANPWCSPTRATIQTGRYSFRTGIGDPVRPDNQPLLLEELTLPELLDRGTGGAYAHATIGKWHLGNESVGGPAAPIRAGYDYFAGSLGNLKHQNYHAWWKVVARAEGEPTVGMTTTYATTDSVDEALAWIADVSEPWFVHLAFNAPHFPYDIPPPHLHSQPLLPELSGRAQPVEKVFPAVVEALDAEIGRLLGALSADVLEDTTVIFVGDNGTHGPAAREPCDPERAKGTLYEGGIRVPLIVAGGGAQKAGGSEVTALVSTVDLFATVGDLAGVDWERLEAPVTDSVSLVPYFDEPDRAPLREFAFAEFFRPNGQDPTNYGRALRDARFKLIVCYDKPDLLFDLALDPHERAPLDLADLDAEQSTAYARLHARLAELLASN